MNQFDYRQLRIGPLSAVLIGLSVLVALLSRLGADQAVLEHLFITNFSDTDGPLLPEVMHGQLWRLLTPIFIHFGFVHLLFNMLWLKDLGTAVEKLESSRRLGTLVIVIGVLSNLGQFRLAGSNFGGMSGVVYGLLGYVWMQSRFAPSVGYFVSQQTVIWMIGWFVLCLTGAMGNVANGAHAAGLLAGVVWGYFSAKTASARLI